MPLQPIAAPSKALRVVLCLAPFLVLLLGAWLRIPGLYWGIPDSEHPNWSFHPDEGSPLQWARLLQQGVFTQYQFVYGGTFHFTVLNTYRHYALVFPEWLGGINDLADTLMLGRILVVGYSLLTLAIVYATGRLLYDRMTALLGMAFLAVTPVHALLTRSVRPDEMSTLLVSVQLYGAARLLRSAGDGDRLLLLALGLLTGVATALRFPLAVFGLVPIMACTLRDSSDAASLQSLSGKCLRAAALTALGAIGGYILSSPYSLLHPQELLEGIALQKSMLSAVFPDAVGRGPLVLQHAWIDLSDGLGWPLYALSLAGILFAMLRRDRSDRLLLMSLAPYFILLSLSTWVVVRYTMPLMPALTLLAASFLVSIGRRGLLARRLAPIVAGSAIAWTFLATLVFACLLKTRDPRELASDWIAANTAGDTLIADIQAFPGDIFSNPPVPPGHPTLHFLLDEQADIDALAGQPDNSILVINESIYRNIDRLGKDHPFAAGAALDRLIRDGRLQQIAAFQRPAQFMGLNFSNWFRSQDYLIMNTGIRLYRWQKPVVVPGIAAH